MMRLIKIFIILLLVNVLQAQYSNVFKLIDAEDREGLLELIQYDKIDLNTITDNKGLPPLHYAVVNKRNKIIPFLIEQGADIYLAIQDDGFPASLAVLIGELDILKIFVEEFDFDVNKREPSQGWTLLHYAAYNNKREIIKYLITKGADPLRKDYQGNFPYQIASNSGVKNYLALKAYLNAAAKGDLKLLNYIKDDANLPIDGVDPETGKNALHVAVENGHFLLVKHFIEKGISPNDEDFEDRNSLWYACASNNLDIVKYLIRNGVEWRKAVPKYGFPFTISAQNSKYLPILKYFIEVLHFNVNSQDKEGKTLLHVAVKYQQMEVVEYLLKHGADPYIADFKGNRPIDYALNDKIKKILIGDTLTAITTPMSEYNDLGRKLIQLAKKGRGDSIIILFENNKQIDWNYTDHFGNTALHYASQDSFPRTIKTLLAYGANPNIKNNDGYFPLHYACKTGFLENIKILVQHGAVFQEATEQSYPVNMAIMEGYLHIVAYFIDSLKFPVNLLDYTGNTMLHYAIMYNKENIIKYLINRGANPYLLNDENKSSLDIASENNMEYILNILKKVSFDDDLFMQAIRAVQMEDTVKLIQIIDKIPDINKKDVVGNTLLHYAVAQNNSAVFSIIVNNKKIKFNIKNEYGITPVAMAIKRANINALKYFIKKGINIVFAFPTKTEFFRTVFLLPDKKIQKIFDLFFNNFVFPDNFSDENGETLLHWAIKTNKDTIFTYIMEKYSLHVSNMVNLKNKNGETPLFYALKKNKKVLSRILLDKGANVEIKNNDGQTVIDIAIKNKYKYGWFISLLREKRGYLTTTEKMQLFIKKIENYILSVIKNISSIPIKGRVIIFGIIILIIIFASIIFIKKSSINIKTLDQLEGYTLISKTGFGTIENYQSISDFRTISSVQEAFLLMKRLNVPNAIIQFQDSFIVVKKKKVKSSIFIKIKIANNELIVKVLSNNQRGVTDAKV